MQTEGFVESQAFSSNNIEENVRFIRDLSCLLEYAGYQINRIQNGVVHKSRQSKNGIFSFVT